MKVAEEALAKAPIDRRGRFLSQSGLAFTHQRVKRVRQLLRKRSLRWAERSLVVEGAELLSVALAAGATVEAVYVAPRGRGRRRWPTPSGGPSTPVPGSSTWRPGSSSGWPTP